jgi:hypothetical protein
VVRSVLTNPKIRLTDPYTVTLIETILCLTLVLTLTTTPSRWVPDPGIVSSSWPSCTSSWPSRSGSPVTLFVSCTFPEKRCFSVPCSSVDSVPTGDRRSCLRNRHRSTNRMYYLGTHSTWGGGGGPMFPTTIVYRVVLCLLTHPSLSSLRFLLYSGHRVIQGIEKQIGEVLSKSLHWGGFLF